VAPSSWWWASTRSCSPASASSRHRSDARDAGGNPTDLIERIHRAGPVPFSTFVDAALYGDDGFFTRGGGAGRAGRDFVTSPEVGGLFGACVARALDGWWHQLAEPDPFVVMEAGAGRGRLCRDALRAAPACAPALHYVLVERSPGLRAAQRELLTVEPFEHALGPARPDTDGVPRPVAGSGPIVTALDELPALTVDGVVLANELLDNLPFDLVERTAGGWVEIRVGVTDTGDLCEMPVAASEEIVHWLGDLEVPVGARVPVQRAVETWIDDCATRLHRGFVVLLDYAVEVDELVARGREGLRTYRGHERGSDPLVAPGEQDITADVLLPTLRRGATRAGFAVTTDTSQKDWLRSVGLDALVAEGRAAWDAGAARGDLEALAGRSRITEADALTDPAGLGAHRVLVLTKRLAGRGSGGRSLVTEPE
jgi:NADH dehydrogenase [ubiquinone] 1 alpha subcomplex assembly factor 7